MGIKKTKRYINFPMFRASIEVTVSNKIHKLNKKENIFDMDLRGAAAVTTESFSDGWAAVLISSKHFDEEVAAHETIHLVTALYNKMGEKSPGEETTAYLVGYISGEITKAVKKYKKKYERTA